MLYIIILTYKELKIYFFLPYMEKIFKILLLVVFMTYALMVLFAH